MGAPPGLDSVPGKHEAVDAGEENLVRRRQREAAPGTRDGFRESFATWAVLPFVLIEQARIAETRGRIEEAAGHYLRIVRLYDLPTTPQGAAIQAEARTALERLTETRR